MRKSFAKALHQQMQKNDQIFLITGDLGFKLFDEIRKDFPDRAINTGAAEQSMMGIGVGLAMEGKIPFVYSITPFLLFRTAETIRNYVNHEQIPVKLIGSGRDKDYSHDGFSHYAGDDSAILELFPHIEQRWPDQPGEIEGLVDEMINVSIPYYLNLKR